MLTAYITSVTTRFNPFYKQSRAARNFLALLPANARSRMAIDMTVLPRNSKEKPSLSVTFKDGKKMDLDLSILKTNDVVAELDRHSRTLARIDDLKN